MYDREFILAMFERADTPHTIEESDINLGSTGVWEPDIIMRFTEEGVFLTLDVDL